jgi:hypothetical protein
MGLRRSRLRLALLAAPLLVAGCVPGAVSIASYSFDGFSYATTGKSLSDRAISQAEDQNCAVWRVLLLRPVCRDYTPEERKEIDTQLANLKRAEPGKTGNPDYLKMRNPPAPTDPHERQLQVATAPGGGVDPASLGALRPAGEPVPRAEPIDLPSARHVDGEPLAAEAMDASERRAAGPVTAARPSPRPDLAAAPPRARPSGPAAGRGQVYLVLASFGTRANAERALARYPALHPLLATGSVDGRIVHRLVSGPVAGADLAAERARLEAAYGIRNAWALPGCARPGEGGCVAAVAMLAAPAKPMQLAALPAK